MFLFAHLGIGKKLVSPWSRGVPTKFLLLGTLFPDLLDKSLYYGMSFATGKQGAELGIIQGTRTLGHTALFLCVILLLGKFRRSKFWIALGLGMTSHLLLDILSNFLSGLTFSFQSSFDALSPFLWPLTGISFPLTPYHNMNEHIHMWHRPFIFGCEIIGLALLMWDLIKARINEVRR